MTNTPDKGIDRGLTRLPLVAPERSVWPEIERRLAATVTEAERTPELPASHRDSVFSRVRLVAVACVAIAVVGLGLAILPGLDSTRGMSFLAAGKPASKDDPTNEASATETATINGGQIKPSPDGLDTRGKYVRQLYYADEALWDAMLEKEIALVDEAMLYSSAAEQRELWQYRKNLTRQLAALRTMQSSKKYWF
ncbi:MAG TPA: hypothetical protein DCZ13_12180 [Porticoccaceae bacterium]|nr:hypothetical protein [Porticoccaceae bacterium]